MPNLEATLGESSMSSLPTLTLPLNSSASFSTIGASTLQGPHQTALKSRRNGTPALRTSVSKLPSLISRTFAPAMTSLSGLTGCLSTSMHACRTSSLPTSGACRGRSRGRGGRGRGGGRRLVLRAEVHHTLERPGQLVGGGPGCNPQRRALRVDRQGVEQRPQA